MNIEIRKLTPEFAEDYLHFFEVTPHDDNTDKDELPCYCVTWRSDDSYVSDGDHWFSTREERRDRAFQFIKAGHLQGYLAYLGEDVVGWCNANSDCQGCVNYLRSFWPINDYHADIKIKYIFCFAVAPEMQRKGVATKMLERVCQDATADGFEFIEAFTHREFNTVPHDFRGPLTMYEKCGFTISGEREGRVTVRKILG